MKSHASNSDYQQWYEASKPSKQERQKLICDCISLINLTSKCLDFSSVQ